VRRLEEGIMARLADSRVWKVPSPLENARPEPESYWNR
jgi:hypothetical protein